MKGVISEENKVKACFADKDLSSWTATGQVLDSWTATGHVKIPTVVPDHIGVLKILV